MKPNLSDAELLDSTLKLESFTGVDIELRTAGVYVRGIARFVDDVIKLVLIAAVGLITMPFGNLGTGIALIMIFVIWWFYSVIFEVSMDGVTPGKHLMGLRAVNADGTPIGFISSMIRSALLFVDALPVFYVCGIVTMAISGSHQRIGDIVAGTVVIYSKRSKSRYSKTNARGNQVPVGLTTEERMLFLAYQERINDLAPERAIELAETLTPLLGKSGGEAVSETLGIAQGIRQGV